MIDNMFKRHEERKANPRSRSESASRGVSRSLASELEEVDEDVTRLLGEMRLP